MKKCKGPYWGPEGDEHNVPEDVFHEEWEQDAQQLHEDEWRIYEVHFLFKEYEVIHMDYCIGDSDILQILDDSELDVCTDHQDKSCSGWKECLFEAKPQYYLMTTVAHTLGI